MLRGLIKGATTAAGVSAIVLSGASLIAPTSEDARRPGIGAPGARPAPPAMATVEDPAPARPEALPDRAAVEAVSPDPETEKAVDLAIPAGSQFNRPREDFQPVVPDAGEAARGFASVPTSRPRVDGPAVAPAPDTSSGGVPEPGTVVAGVAAPEAGVAPSLPAPVEDGVPISVRDAAPIGEAPESAPASETIEDGSARATPGAPILAEDTSAANAPEDAAPTTTASDAPAAEIAAPVAVQTLPPLSDGVEQSVDEAPALPAGPGDGAPRRLAETAPAGAAPEAVAAIAPPAAEPRPQPGRPAISEVVTPTEAPDPAQDTALAGADAPSERPVSTVVSRLGGTSGGEDTAPAEGASGAPVVLEQVSAPVAVAPGTRSETPQVFRDAPVAPDAERAATEPEGAVRIVPRRIVLDSARQPSAAPDVAPAAAPAGDGRALTVHATEFRNPEDKPLFSIVLIDEATGGVARSALLDLDMALTFAIDPARPDAASVAEAYRAAGHEVLMLADSLPVAGAPPEIETALSGARAALPQAVGVLDRRAAGFTRNRTALSALVGPLAEAGLGFVAYGGGLGDGLATAERRGVPSEAVFRIIDDGSERATVLTRYLDRATFEAAQEGRVIVVGRTRPAMVTALLSWTLGRRAETVVLAPVSAVLLASESGS